MAAPLITLDVPYGTDSDPMHLLDIYEDAERTDDATRAAIILVHGGPGSAELAIGWTFQRGWEDYFTVVQWDQRGAGQTDVQILGILEWTVCFSCGAVARDTAKENVARCVEGGVVKAERLEQQRGRGICK